MIVDAKALRLPDLTEHPDSFGFPPNHPPMRSFLGVPIHVRGEVFGNLYRTDKSRAEVFTDIDEELVVGLAAAAGVAIDNARLLGKVKELALVEDRERIARDLHDTVIQRLFATGMSLQSTVRLIGTDAVAAIGRIEGAVDDLDLTIREIRTAIFGLEQARPIQDGLRHRILALALEAAGPLGFEPRVVLDGPVDTPASTMPSAPSSSPRCAKRSATSPGTRRRGTSTSRSTSEETCACSCATTGSVCLATTHRRERAFTTWLPAPPCLAGRSSSGPGQLVGRSSSGEHRRGWAEIG